MHEEIAKLVGKHSIGDLKWAQAINSTVPLEGAISNHEIDFLEVDISLSQDNKPIAAHYPDRTSDLSLTNLFSRIKNSNKGLKLDFKDQETVTPCLEELASSELQQPIILNADVLSVENAPGAIIHPDVFINACQKHYPAGLLSLGWRTTQDIGSVYTANDIDKMLRICMNLDAVTFPVRASMLPGSWENIKRLIEKDHYSLTVWSSEPLSNELKKWIFQNTDKQKCFYAVDL